MKGRVLVIRKKDIFTDRLNSAGIKTHILPLLAAEETHAEIPELSQFDGVMITSRNAAKPLAEHLQNFPDYQGKIYILGKRSYDLLKTSNVEIVFDEGANTAEEMLNAIGIDDFRGKKLLHLRGDKSIGTIKEQLGQIAELQEIIVYKTVEIRLDKDQVKEVIGSIENGDIEWAAFFSPSGVDAFINNFGTGVVKYLKAAAIGTTTAKAAKDHGFSVGHIAENADAAAFADGLAAKIKGNK